MALDIVGWNGRTAADHQQEVNTWSAQGYRTITLSVSGDPTAPLYAAVMIKRAQVIAEKQVIGMSGATFQSTFDEMAQSGWGPLIVTATGPGSTAVFAASWFQMSSIPLTKFGMTAADFTAQNQAAMQNGQILGYADVYGEPGNLIYIAVWVANTSNLAWNCDGIDDNQATMQARFNALTSGFARATHSAVTPDGGQLSLYDDSTANPWIAHGFMTGADYQQYWDQFWPSGQRVLRMDAKGTGNATLYTAIWGTHEGYDARKWRMSGSPGIAAIDDAVKAVMSANMVRGASLAITVGTRLVYARGYTFAEPSYPDVQPTTTFRQASVSKTFTAAAIWQLIEEGKLTLSTPLHAVLPLAALGGPPPPNWDKITIQYMLEMIAGITANILGTDANVSSSLPIGALQMAEWVAGQPLGNVPGDKTQANYSNASYMLLGLVVAQLRNASTFIEAIQDSLLTPLSITRVISATSLVSQQPPGEARYHSRPLQTGKSVMVTGQPLCALGYGDANLENCGGAGGLSGAAVDVARLVAALSITGDGPILKQATLQRWLKAAATATATLSGPSAHGYYGFDGVNQSGSTFSGDKGGSLSTSQNAIWFTTGGIGTVMCWNTPVPTGPTWYPNDPTILSAAAAQDWGSTDLFASTYGMPSLEAAAQQAAPRPPLPIIPAMRGSQMTAPGARRAL